LPYNNIATLGGDPSFPPGSVEAQLGVNRRSGVAVLTPQRIAMLPPEVQRFAPEYDAAASPAQRAEARTRRLSEDRAVEAQAAAAAVAALHETKQPPVGWVIVHGPSGASVSVGANLGNDFRLVRQNDADILRSHGWGPAAWPAEA